MPRLSRNEIIMLRDGSSVCVEALIGSGGQGEVYRVRWQAKGGKIAALKWYTEQGIIENKDFYKSLCVNASRPAPSEAFLWPLAVACYQKGSFGYIMHLCPEGYEELGNFFSIDRHPEAWFRSFDARLRAAIIISDAFARLHLQGLSYQDINDGNFFINPVSGDVRICDNDNISINGTNHGIGGKPHYMAPEVIAGSIPTAYSDRLSLAIILYRIFMTDHPFEGASTTAARHACMTPEVEARVFGSEAVFCHDASDSSNRPVAGLHDNSVRFWPLMPALLRRAFSEALSRRAILNPAVRLSGLKWKSILVQARRLAGCCQACETDPPHDFLADAQLPSQCPLCGEAMSPEAWLRFDHDGSLYRLMRHKPLYIDDSSRPEGRCVRMKGDDSRAGLALLNCGKASWTVLSHGGRGLEVAPGRAVQLLPGLALRFSADRSARVVSDHSFV